MGGRPSTSGRVQGVGLRQTEPRGVGVEGRERPQIFLCLCLGEMGNYDRTARAPETHDLGLKSLEAKKLAKEVHGLDRLIESLHSNLQKRANGMPFGALRTALWDATDELAAAFQGTRTAEEHLRLAGGILENAGSGLVASTYDYARQEAVTDPLAGPRFRAAHGAKPPPGFRENPETGELYCPHRDVSCCDACAKKHPEIVEVHGQHFWTHSPREKAELLGLLHKHAGDDDAHGLRDR